MSGRDCLRILVVDDNPEAANLISESLNDLGAEAEACLSGVDALAHALRFRPQILMLDLDMPGMDGFELAQTLRRRDDFRPAKLIAQTAYGDAATRAKTARAGFDLHLTKPLGFARLGEMLDLLGSVLNVKPAQFSAL
ncbi:MAG TPA: response regulator [Asticcacaulis sp.]|nr:response regulator [Asticcacaulis sp.]